LNFPEDEEYAKKTPLSKAAYDRLSSIFPGGVNSAIQFFNPYPIYVAKGLGGKLWDVDGREYVDHCLSYGAMTAGHANPVITQAIRDQLERGTLLGLPGQGVEELAREIMRRYPFVEMLRITNTGAEATFNSVRLARAVTGRSLVVKIEGAYHGALDTLLVSDKPNLSIQLGSRMNPASNADSLGTPQEVVDQIITIHFNDIQGLERALKTHENRVAAFIVEPLMTGSGVVPPDKGYFQAVRKLCDDYGVIFILDEVKTGCNVAEGGGSQLFDIRPDLACFAKTVGGGTPLAAFGGKREYMEGIMPLGGTAHFGTYNANALCVAAGVACLKKALTPTAYSKMAKLSDQLYGGIEDAIKDTKTRAVLGRCAMMGQIYFGLDAPPRNFREAVLSDRTKWHRYWISMLNRGVIPSGSAWFEQAMVSAMHEPDDIEKSVHATYDTLKYLSSQS
jgi:glutamate-1-semialdehyde 2,1-aminomutase